MRVAAAGAEANEGSVRPSWSLPCSSSSCALPICTAPADDFTCTAFSCFLPQPTSVCFHVSSQQISVFLFLRDMFGTCPYGLRICDGRLVAWAFSLMALPFWYSSKTWQKSTSNNAIACKPGKHLDLQICRPGSPAHPSFNQLAFCRDCSSWVCHMVVNAVLVSEADPWQQGGIFQMPEPDKRFKHVSCRPPASAT